MRSLSLRIALVVAAFAVFGGCASKKVNTDKPILGTIALIPATEPDKLTLANENGVVFLSPITALGFHLDSKEKAKLFNQTLSARNLGLGQKLTAEVSDALRAKGYRLVVPEDIARPADDPDDVDYQKLKVDADLILQLRIDEVGLYSSKFSTDYLPRVNVQAKLYVRSIDDSIYDENLYYGVDAKPANPFMIVSDPKFAYPSYETVIARSDEIGAVFVEGIARLSRRLATQLIETLETKTRAAR